MEAIDKTMVISTHGKVLTTSGTVVMRTGTKTVTEMKKPTMKSGTILTTAWKEKKNSTRTEVAKLDQVETRTGKIETTVVVTGAAITTDTIVIMIRRKKTAKILAKEMEDRVLVCPKETESMKDGQKTGTMENPMMRKQDNGLTGTEDTKKVQMDTLKAGMKRTAVIQKEVATRVTEKEDMEMEASIPGTIATIPKMDGMRTSAAEAMAMRQEITRTGIIKTPKKMEKVNIQMMEAGPMVSKAEIGVAE
jgi:hypothetical protein